MKTIIALFLSILFLTSCQPNKMSTKIIDSRPKSQVEFLQRIKNTRDSIDMSYGNSAKKDQFISSIDKYLIDSVKQFKDWKLIVENISDFNSDGNSFYQIDLTCPVKIDNSIDTISIDNKVDFTFSIPKKPKDRDLSKAKEIISKLNIGDTIKFSGVILMTDKDLKKITLTNYFDTFNSSKISLLLKEIKK